eukprot:scaffold98323_cov69-Phaeocystis_antarctica.AAC.2
MPSCGCCCCATGMPLGVPSTLLRVTLTLRAEAQLALYRLHDGGRPGHALGPTAPGRHHQTAAMNFGGGEIAADDPRRNLKLYDVLTFRHCAAHAPRRRPWPCGPQLAFRAPALRAYRAAARSMR